MTKISQSQVQVIYKLIAGTRTGMQVIVPCRCDLEASGNNGSSLGTIGAIEPIVH